MLAKDRDFIVDVVRRAVRDTADREKCLKILDEDRKAAAFVEKTSKSKKKK